MEGKGYRVGGRMRRIQEIENCQIFLSNRNFSNQFFLEIFIGVDSENLIFELQAKTNLGS